MTNYKNIFGKPVKFLATDPDNAEAEGQIWYNSTSDAFKTVLGGGTWSAGAPLNTARRFISGAGTQTAGLGFGGYSPGNTAATELYDGSTWTASTSLATARRQIVGCGTQPLALAMGGFAAGDTALTEEFTGAFNGTVTLTTS